MRGTISWGDLVRLGLFGLRTRPTRVALSALGIAIGIAAMIAVVGISSSSKAELDEVLESLGTNVLTATQAQGVGEPEPLPVDAVRTAERQDDLLAAAGVGRVTDSRVYRTDRVPVLQTNGIGVQAAFGDVPGVLSGEFASGRWLDERVGAPPQVVLGAAAAERLGVGADGRVWIDGQWVAVVGVLRPMPLAPELDTQVFVPRAMAVAAGFDGRPTAVYTRADPADVPAARERLARSIAPLSPSDVAVSRPSDALAAKSASEASFTGLLVGIGGVALLVGGIGVANTMVITVLERRAEVGVRRSLGARRRDIRNQFFVESLLLSLVGGAAGVVIGVGVTVAFALAQGWPIAIPMWALAGGLGATVVIGGVSGLYPAARAAAIPPTSALAAA